MSPSAEVNRVRFARVVARILADARDRGLTDDDIEKATGVGSSTFHRWQKGQFQRSPSIEKVQAFCAGLGVPVRPVLLALGVVEGRDDPDPDPTVDPDVRRIARMLADPATSDEDKAVIRRMLQMISNQVRPANRQSRG